MLNIVCFKWKKNKFLKSPVKDSGGYSHVHVNKLYEEIEKNLTIPHRFVCITDNPSGIKCETLPLWTMNKSLEGCYIRLFAFLPLIKQYLGERVALIDLDVAILGNLDSLFLMDEEFIIHQYQFLNPVKQYYNGSLIIMNAGCRKQVFEDFTIQSVEKIRKENARKTLIGTDQAWISYILGEGEKTVGEKEGIYEYLNIQGRGVPKDAKMVFFSGKRDPSTVKEKWVNEYWNE